MGDTDAEPGLRLRDEEGWAIRSQGNRVPREGYPLLSGVGEPEVSGRPPRAGGRIQDSIDGGGQGEVTADLPTFDTFQGQEGTEGERSRVQTYGGWDRCCVGQAVLLEEGGRIQIHPSGFLLWFGRCDVSAPRCESGGEVQPRLEGQLDVGLRIPFPSLVITFVHWAVSRTTYPQILQYETSNLQLFRCP